MQHLCVFCGSSAGNREVFGVAAGQLGAAMVSRDMALVYGGASVGVMGAVADAVVASGGEAYGVIPESMLDDEVAHDGLTELYVVKSMHERKARMADMSDGFLGLPGGLGTLEELFEMLTWSQLRIHSKPVGLLNVDGFYDSLIHFLDQTVAAGFVRPEHRAMLVVDSDVARLLDAMVAWQAPTIEKWWR